MFMTRAELIEANSALRDAIGEVADLIDLDFEAQSSMDMDELEEENAQLQEALFKVRDLAEEAVEESAEDDA
jgi:hypothetical protein